MALDQNLTLSEAYERQEKLQKEKEKIEAAVRIIYREADIEVSNLLKKQDSIDDELKLLNIEIEIRSRPFCDGKLQFRN